MQIPKENAPLIDLDWTEDEQSNTLKALVESYTSHGGTGACRVHRWRLACLSLVLGAREDHNNMSRKWYSEWPLDTLVDTPVFRWLRETFLPVLVNQHAEYPEPDEDDPLREAYVPEQGSHAGALPSAPPPQQAVLFCPLPDHACHLKWW